MHRLLAVITGFLLLIVSGLIHGWMTSRWIPSETLAQASNSVPTVPMKFERWQGVELEVDPAPFRQARASAYWMRRYENKETGAVINTILMCGPAGPMSVHTPDVCYRGAGYQLEGKTSTMAFSYDSPESPAYFWTGDFQKSNPDLASRLRLYWSWSADGSWQAPQDPRFTFGGKSALYKLYLIQQVNDENAYRLEEMTKAFLKDFLPTLNQSLKF